MQNERFPHGCVVSGFTISTVNCSITQLKALLFVVDLFLTNIPVLASKAEPVHNLIFSSQYNRRTPV